MMRIISQSTSPFLVAGVTALTLSSSPVIHNDSTKMIPVYQIVTYYEEETSTPKIHSFAKASEKDEALNLFSGSRDFTKEEAALYEESLSDLFQPTGRNFFDL